MPWKSGGGGGAASEFIKGSVDTYALLPDPTTVPNQLWFVKNPDRVIFPKYPRGFYWSDGVAWELTPIKVKWTEDAGSVINWTDWNLWITSGASISTGDRVIYNDIMYRNTTGTQTATAPDTDTTNWTKDGVETRNTSNMLYIKGDAANPVVNDERISTTSIYVIYERYSGTAWVEISRIGGSLYIPRFIEIIKEVNAEILVNDEANNQIRNLIKSATFSNGTVVGDIFGDSFVLAEDKFYKVKPLTPLSWSALQPVDTSNSTGTSFSLSITTPSVDGIISTALKFKGTIPVGTVIQGKIFKQSDLVNPVWENVTDFQFSQGIGTPVDSVTGISETKPNVYLIGNTPLKYVYNFSQSVTLAGSTTDGTSIYLEAEISRLKFENIQVDNVDSLTADATHIDNADYLVHTTASVININVPFDENSTFTVRDADANFATNSCNVLFKDAGGSLQYTVTLDNSNESFFFFNDGTNWNYSRDGEGKTYAITSNRTASVDFPDSAGYWSRTGITLSPKTAGDQILTTGNVTADSMNTNSIHYSGELNFVGVAGGTRITSDREIYVQGTIESNYELTSRRVNLTSPATIESDVIRVVNSDGHGNFYLRTGTDGIQMRNTIYGAGALWFALNDNGNVGIGKVTASEKLDVDGTVKATTFSGDLNGTINTVTTATTQDSRDVSTKVATTEFVDTAISGINQSKWARNETTKVLSPNNFGDSVSIDSTTITEKALSVEANTLTTGAGLYVGSSSSGLNDKLVELSISDASATGDVLSIDNNGTGQAIDITSNSTTNDVIKVVSDNLVSGSMLSLRSASSSDILRDLIEIKHTGTGNSTSAIDINLGASRGSILNGYSSNTTLPALRLDSDSLTYGAVAHFASNSPDTNIRKLVHIQNSNALSTGTTGLVIDQASTSPALSTNGDIVTTGDLTAANVTVGNNLGISQSGVTNLVVGATANTSKLYFGQDINRNLVIEWTYNATPEDASARMTTWGYANDFFIDAKVLSLQTKNSPGLVGIGTDDPQAKLDVRGNIRVGDWTSSDVSIVGAPASGGDFNIGQTSGAGKIKFVSNGGADLITIQNDGDMGIGNNAPAVKLHVDTNSANTVAIQRLENTAGNFDIFRSDATPESSITGSMGDLAVDSTNGNTYTKHSGNATNTGWTQLQTNPSGTYDILTAADLEALATGSIITVSSNLMLNIKAPISSNVVYVMQTGATLGITYSLGGSYTYTGSSNQFSGVGGSLKMRNGSMTASGSSATLFSNSFTSPFEVINIQGTLFSGYNGGSITGRGSFTLEGCAFIDYRSSLIVSGHSSFKALNVNGYSATVFPAVPAFNIRRGYGGTAINIFNVGSWSLYNGSLVRFDPALGDNSKSTLSSMVMNLGDLFDTSGTTGTFTAVADASYSGITIDNVSDVSGNARFNYTVPALYVGQEVVVSGFLTYTAYNKTGIVSAVSSGSWFELESTPYIGSENGTGQFGVNSVTLTDTATTLSDGDSIDLDTTLATSYENGTYVYNKQANSVQVNKTWAGTASGTWSTKGLDQNSCRITAHDNEGHPDSVNIASCFSSGNTSNTTTSTTSFLPLELGTAALGQSNSRFKLLNTSTGEFEYTGMSTLWCTMHASVSARKTGTSRIYNFKFVKTGGTGAAFDNVIASRDITSRVGSLTLTTSATLDPGDTFRVEVEAEETGNDILVTNFSMVVE